MSTYSLGGGYGDQSAIYWGAPGSANLGWEKSKNLNVGIDLSLFHRVNLTLEYYNKRQQIFCSKFQRVL